MPSGNVYEEKNNFPAGIPVQIKSKSDTGKTKGRDGKSISLKNRDA